MEKRSSFVANVIYFIVVCLFVTLRLCGQFGLFSFMGETGNYIINLVLQVGILFVFSLVMFKTFTKSTYKQTFNNFGYRKVSFKVILISIGIGLVVYILNIFVSSFFYSVITSLGYQSPQTNQVQQTVGTFVLSLIFTAILPAVCEEHLHRGMLLHGNSNLKLGKNILLTGLLFGLLHLNIEQFFYASIIGFFLGFIAILTNSIYPCMIIHFMNNAISVTLSYIKSQGVQVGSIFEQIFSLTSKNFIIGFIVILLFIFVLAVCLICLVTMLAKQSLYDSYACEKRKLVSKSMRSVFLHDVNEIKGKKEEPKEKQVFEIDEFLKNIDDQIEIFENNDFKMGKITKVFIIGSLVLSGVVTLFTFIWGII